MLITEPIVLTPELNGIYFVKGLASPNTAQRNLTLVLSGDGTAILIIEFVGKGTILERGRWIGKTTQAEIMWTELDGQAIALHMNFELRDNALVYIGPDPNALGSVPVRLGRVCEGMHTIPSNPMSEPFTLARAQTSPL